MKKLLNKLIASVLAATMTVTALPLAAFAAETTGTEVQALGNARKNQDVLFASGAGAMQHFEGRHIQYIYFSGR